MRRRAKLSRAEENNIRGWMLIFKGALNVQPVVVLGTLDEINRELDKLRKSRPDFTFAVIYRPNDGGIYRLWRRKTT